MTHILLNLPEEYQNIVEVLWEELYDEGDTLTLEKICDKLLEKYDGMDKKSIPKTTREDETSL